MRNQNERLVNFVLIGVGKAGTTWLARMLQEHPNIFIPKEKEPSYFNEIYADDFSLKNPNVNKPFSWYANFSKMRILIKY